jgi:hypothetical protein
MANEKWKFNLRSFTSFTLVISTLIMSWSGFILYVAPPGRIANWGTWKLMLFTKAEWQALHTIFSYLFFILVIIHLFFVNWKTFLTYIKSRLKSGLNKKWELGTAILLSSVFFVGTLRHWTPFEPVMAFGEKVKEGWETDFQTPPVLHMETYSLQQLSPLIDSIAPAELIKTLQENQIRVSSPEASLKDIATENNTTPSAIYEILRLKYNSKPLPVQNEAPQGVGKYTINSTATNSGIEVTVMLQKLKEKGIEADGETSLKTIADKLGVTPRDVYTLLTGK